MVVKPGLYVNELPQSWQLGKGKYSGKFATQLVTEESGVFE